MLRGAFIGFGNIALHGHMPGWLRRGDVSIVAAVDGAGERRAAFLEICTDGQWYNDVDALLAEQSLDFVDICTPPGSHAALIRRAVQADIAVLCEKPLVTRIEDAALLAELSAGRVVHCVHNWLEAPICRQVTALIDDGAIGPVRALRWRTLRTKPAIAVATEESGKNWRTDPALAGGGILFDHGWHALYCLCRWSGRAPSAIAASLVTRRFHEWPLEDTADIALDFGAASGKIFLTWTAAERENTIEVEGEAGRIRADGATVELEGASGRREWTFPQALSEGSHHPDWFDGIANDFCAALSDKAPSNFREATLCARLIDLAQKSSRSGGTRIALEG